MPPLSKIVKDNPNLLIIEAGNGVTISIWRYQQDNIWVSVEENGKEVSRNQLKQSQQQQQKTQA